MRNGAALLKHVREELRLFVFRFILDMREYDRIAASSMVECRCTSIGFMLAHSLTLL